MPTTSPIQGVPVPQGSDADNVPYDLGQAIGFMEKRLVMVFSDAAARDATIASPSEGMVAYLQATDEFTARIGSSWVRILSRNDLAGSGSATTVAKSDHGHSDLATSGHGHAGMARVQRSTAGTQANVNGRVYVATGFTFSDQCVVRVSQSISGTEENAGIEVSGTSGASGVVYLTGIGAGQPGVHITVID